MLRVHNDHIRNRRGKKKRITTTGRDGNGGDERGDVWVCWLRQNSLSCPPEISPTFQRGKTSHLSLTSRSFLLPHAFSRHSLPLPNATHTLARLFDMFNAQILFQIISQNSLWDTTKDDGRCPHDGGALRGRNRCGRGKILMHENEWTNEGIQI